MVFSMLVRLLWVVTCFGPKDRRENLEWKGWWGSNPPYHAPVFVLSHYERAPIEMEGGTTFHFVTDGIESAIRKAKEAAGDRNVKIMGGEQIPSISIWLLVSLMNCGCI